MLSDFGKIVTQAKYKKNAMGIKVEGILTALNNPDLFKEIVLVDEGKTDKGWEFMTMTLYLRSKK